MIRRNQKFLVAVFMGGSSAEHEVSLRSGEEILKYLDRDKYRVRSILISKKNEWFLDKRKVKAEEALGGVDVVFNAMHGEYGEDGRAQAFLEHYGLPYTGSGVVASVLGMDKFASRTIFKSHGLHTPRTFRLTRREYKNAESGLLKNILHSLGKMPWVVKPCSRGSSVGVSVVKNDGSLRKACMGAFAFDDVILIEERLNGTEITIPIL